MATARPKSEKGRLELAEIKRLIEMIERSPITEFELVDKDLRIRISKNGKEPTVQMVAAQPMTMAQSAQMPMAPTPAMADGQGAAPAPAKAVSLHEVKSPMVGTMYRAPAPDADPYVRVGDVIEPGKVLCIVEAMKLMNELESEVSGRIVEICVENAQPVEFGQVLFRIDTSA
jgi:acetyl-CoA carboxylase biotin carboxyl carrier protein